MSNMRKGWYNERARHSLAKRGYKTTYTDRAKTYVPIGSEDYYAIVHGTYENDEPYGVYTNKRMAEEELEAMGDIERRFWSPKIKKVRGPRLLYDLDDQSGGTAHIIANNEKEALSVFLNEVSDYADKIKINVVSRDRPHSNVYEILYDYKE